MTNTLRKMIEKQVKAKTEIEANISETFKTVDPEAIQKIKELLIKSLSSEESFIPGVEFVAEESHKSFGDGVLREFESMAEMKQVVWDTFTSNTHKQCSAEVHEKISKEWNISKDKTNRVLFSNAAWFKKMKNKKINDNGLAVWYFSAKA